MTTAHNMLRMLMAAVLCAVFIAVADTGRADPDADNWGDIRRLDTAKDADYLTGFEKDVILEMNKARTNPRKFSALYISPMLWHFNGNEYSPPERVILVTKEGASAVKECIRALNKVSAADPLMPERGLTIAVRDLAADQGITGRTGHVGSDGSTFSSRCKRYGNQKGGLAENVDYGNNIGREVVISLLVDDGFPSRGHRAVVMNGKYTQTGVAAGPHPVYKNMCAITYAWDYVSYPPSERAVSPLAQAGGSAAPAAGLTANPNPATRSSRVISFLWQGKRVESTALPVYDASDRLVSGIEISDDIVSPRGTAKRRVGAWNFKDFNGRPVPAGTYLVRGMLTASDGEKVRVDLTVEIR